MRRAQLFGSLLLAAAMSAPVLATAAPRPEEATVNVRVYDRTHKDYHNWDDHESAAWRVYLGNNHVTFHEYSKADRREQDRYWAWRHDHPDAR